MLPTLTTVRSSVTPTGASAALVALVGRHWHTAVQPAGRGTSSYLHGGSVGVRNPSTTANDAVAVFRATHVYSGAFTCAGTGVTGGYTTFGPVTSVLIDCADPARNEIDRVGHTLCI